jgi:hypothetical protein
VGLTKTTSHNTECSECSKTNNTNTLLESQTSQILHILVPASFADVGGSAGTPTSYLAYPSCQAVALANE